MRNLNELNDHRLKTPNVLFHFGSYGDETCGCFLIPYPRTGVTLAVTASSGDGWDHVSVSLQNRTPNWHEMQHIHRTFFNDHETAWEYHVKPEDHINVMPNCLHLWRKQGFEMPMPPKDFV